jgi:hypothetical protein
MGQTGKTDNRQQTTDTKMSFSWLKRASSSFQNYLLHKIESKKYYQIYTKILHFLITATLFELISSLTLFLVILYFSLFPSYLMLIKALLISGKDGRCTGSCAKSLEIKNLPFLLILQSFGKVIDSERNAAITLHFSI